MLQKPKAYMKKHNMATTGEKVVLGLSGGADSVCLFYVLKNLGYDLEAVHVHHGIRGAAADRDAAFVQSLCKKEEQPPQLPVAYPLNHPHNDRLIDRDWHLW